jgi:hypothetical protein
MRFVLRLNACKFQLSAAVPRMKGVTSLSMQFAEAISEAEASSVIARLRYARVYSYPSQNNGRDNVIRE